MKIKSIFLILLSLCIFEISCTKEVEEIPIDNSGSISINGQMHITAIVCQDLFCTEREMLPELEVEVYLADSITNYKVGTTDENGKLNFFGFRNQSVVLSAYHKGQTYFEKVTFNGDEISFHNIVFSPWCDMIGGRLENCDNSIHLSRMSVGLKSKYLVYKSLLPAMDDENYAVEFLDTLILEVTEKIEDNIWLVKESYNSKLELRLDNDYYLPNGEGINCMWKVYDDHFLISTPDANSRTLLNYNSVEWGDPILIDQCVSDDCSVIGYYTHCQWDAGIEDPTINGISFEGEYCFFNNSLTSNDGPFFGALLNREKGIVHSTVFNIYGGTYAYGVTLIE